MRFATRSLALLIIFFVASPRTAAGATAADAQVRFLKTLDAMMVQLAPQSARASAAIKKAYLRHLDLFVLDEYSELERAIASGGVVPLPSDPLRFNVKPRVDGRAPIAEKDLDNQATYISGRAAAIGALLDIASRVTSGPVEVTSLVRHTEYQDALRKTNSNAKTTIPMHTMGLAIDIALINTPLDTVYEIRDVLTQMQKARDILFIAERRQLVFHVVPHPSRLGHFADVYARAIAESMPGANVIATSPFSDAVSRRLTPSVRAEVINLRPTADFAEEWWIAQEVPSDVTVHVSPEAFEPVPQRAEESLWSAVAARGVAMVTGLVRSAWNLIS
jgi:hypothetical protein